MKLKEKVHALLEEELKRVGFSKYEGKELDLVTVVRSIELGAPSEDLLIEDFAQEIPRFVAIAKKNCAPWIVSLTVRVDNLDEVGTYSGRIEGRFLSALANLDFSQLREVIRDLPKLWYPDVIREAVKAAYKKELFQPGGASILVADAEAEALGPAFNKLYTLKEALKEWTDWDGAAWALGHVIGLFPPVEGIPGELKHIFWTNNPFGQTLHDTLESLVKLGVLEGSNGDERFPHDPSAANLKFRWHPDFNAERQWKNL